MEIKLIKPHRSGPLAYGVKGVGELATIPICPAITGAYYERDGQLRTTLPIDHSYYRKGV
jgi:CO/xanthine dehydrogenase Mo-binding subunit